MSLTSYIGFSLIFLIKLSGLSFAASIPTNNDNNLNRTDRIVNRIAIGLV